MAGLWYGCAFLVLNTAALMLPAWWFASRSGGRPIAVAAGAGLGGLLSFVFGGVWYLLLPRLWEPPPPAGFNLWGWFFLVGWFSAMYAVAGALVVLIVLAVGAAALRQIGGPSRSVTPPDQ